MKIPENRLEFFQSLLKSSIAGRDGAFDNISRWYDQYRGDKRQSSGVDASVVRNITYELIESQVSTEIPIPRVRAYNWSEDNERLARRCELLLKNVRDSLPLERLNDIDERYTYIFGGSVFYLEWDEDERREGVKGRVRINVLNPECFIGQPGVYEIDDMEYCFIRFNTPISEIEKRWGLGEGADSLLERADDLSAVVNICFYRNESGYVSIFNELQMENRGQSSRKRRLRREKMPVNKIDQSLIKNASVENSLADRPSSASLYGSGGLTPKEVKAAYDKLPKLIANHYNALIDAVHNGD
ncbi:MAG: hypothetical protein IJF55_01250, partial [Clostridia bacterium]|nr:hypothetical protein [Clostridia bacterium]